MRKNASRKQKIEKQPNVDSIVSEPTPEGLSVEKETKKNEKKNLAVLIRPRGTATTDGGGERVRANVSTGAEKYFSGRITITALGRPQRTVCPFPRQTIRHVGVAFALTFRKWNMTGRTRIGIIFCRNTRTGGRSYRY